MAQNRKSRGPQAIGHDNGQVQPSKPTVAQLRNKKPLRITETFVLDQDKAERLSKARLDLEMAEARWRAAQKDKDDADTLAKRLEELDAAADEYDEAQTEAAEVAVEFVFVGLGKPRLDQLKREHPPTDEDEKAAKRKGIDPRLVEWHDETYTPALIVECMVEPRMTLDEFNEVIWLSPNWNEAERSKIVMAAMTANQSMSRVDLGKAYARAFGEISGTESNKVSPTESASPAASS